LFVPGGGSSFLPRGADAAVNTRFYLRGALFQFFHFFEFFPKGPVKSGDFEASALNKVKANNLVLFRVVYRGPCASLRWGTELW
jgi:hypothetical protein